MDLGRRTQSSQSKDTKTYRINTYRKGLLNQRKAKEYYQSQGYQVEVVRYSKWLKNKDFFGLWDLICVGPIDIRFVQVKTNQHPDHEWKERARAWKCPKNAVREWVVYRDYTRGVIPEARVTMEPC